MLYRFPAIAALFLCLFTPNFSHAEIRLPRLISDGMVLQRDAPLTIWGWADPGEPVVVSFIGEDHRTQADAAGNWSLDIGPLEAGGPHRMTITGVNTIAVNDILIGEVWVCSGQSNMELSMDRVSPLYPREFAQADLPFVRYFEVPKQYDFDGPHNDLPRGQWQAFTASSVRRFAAVCYFYGKFLYEQYQVPIGLINSALGGSPVEAWISEASLREFPTYYEEAVRFRDDSLIEQIERTDREHSAAWHQSLQAQDRGYRHQPTYHEPEAWLSGPADTMQLPGNWADTPLGAVEGSVWFEREFTIPRHLAGQPAELRLGVIVDADSVFINGAYVGNTTYQYPPRRYGVPAGILRAGSNTLVIRVVSGSGRGGFVEDKPYRLTMGDYQVDLRGAWRYRLGAAIGASQPSTFIRFKPLGLYNAMIAPLQRYRIRGVIWYQGESNVTRWHEYDALFTSLIRDWRSGWGQGDFPFVWVQLPNFLAAREEPADSEWARMREAQANALTLDQTAMAVAIDVGEWNDIHPLNKREVGRRLALAARRLAYGETELVSSGPRLAGMRREGRRMVLTFEEVGSGLLARDG
ncbi:MAG: sialate O-acetylesterase, partial [Lewinella sp.]|nr:sialate O-acetylesterase [Lewinella sp.]